MPSNQNHVNLVFIFADQWRAQATGYAGDPNVKTPHLDRLASESINFTHAISGWPVCSPARASLITGQYPLTHGVFVNDVCLREDAVSLAEAYARAGYRTAYIGKWHLDGHGRSNFIPRERRQGFEHWETLECTHDYNESHYYGDAPEKLAWDAYDAIAQTKAAQKYIRERASDARPFALVLSWGPPHNPYGTAPERFRRLYDPDSLALRPNVPPEAREQARKDLAGYYAHCTALDECVGALRETLGRSGIEDRTLLVFWSDHGDMLGSQGFWRKQKPYEESIRVPLLLRCPAVLGRHPRQVGALINTPDLMPTLLGLCGVEIPETVEGIDYSDCVTGGSTPVGEAALLSCPHPFGEWRRDAGGREFRGVRTRRYTYVRDLEGPWLLFDNERDPNQMANLTGSADHEDVERELDGILNDLLRRTGDDFLPSAAYISRWGYTVDERGTVPYTG